DFLPVATSDGALYQLINRRSKAIQPACLDSLAHRSCNFVGIIGTKEGETVRRAAQDLVILNQWKERFKTGRSAGRQHPRRCQFAPYMTAMNQVLRAQ